AIEASFEGFLLRLATGEVLGPAAPYRALLETLLSLHSSDWGEDEVARLRALVTARLGVCELAASFHAQGDVHELRRELGQISEPGREPGLRIAIAMREAARGEFKESYEVLEPLLLPKSQQREPPLMLDASLASAFVCGRARQRTGRARSLAALAQHLPDAAAAVVYAVASEALLQEGLFLEAEEAAKNAACASPTSARALA